jgi:hypothetical protein
MKASWDNGIMKDFERFEGEAQLSTDVTVEGLTPGEVSLASAERLIERLDAQDTITPADMNEANDMVEELRHQVDSFKEESLTVPQKFTFAIAELTRLMKNEPLSVHELIEAKESAPDDDAATRAREELERLANPE